MQTSVVTTLLGVKFVSDQNCLSLIGKAVKAFDNDGNVYWLCEAVIPKCAENALKYDAHTEVTEEAAMLWLQKRGSELVYHSDAITTL